MMATETFRDRIKELRRVKASELKANEKNWRKHPESQRSVLLDGLRQVGIADAMIARETETGELILIDGHLRQDMSGDQEVPVLILDVDEREADILLATLDPLASMAIADEGQLEEILRDLHSDDNIAQMMESVGDLYNIEFGFGDSEDPTKGDKGDGEFNIIQYVVQIPKHRHTSEVEDELRDISKRIDGKFFVRGGRETD